MATTIKQADGVLTKSSLTGTTWNWRFIGPRAGTPGPEERLPAGHEEALYRIVQEALANVVKHARATSATVTLVRDGGVRVSVEDDGVGFGTSLPAFAYGLAGMRERVAALGGRLQLDNRPAGGARGVAELPFPDDTDR